MRRCEFSSTRGAFTLVEVLLVAGMLVVISAFVIPNFYHELRREELPGSAKQLRALIGFVRANAAIEGKRYRIRFADESEAAELPPGIDVRQPLVEREDDPIDAPEEYTIVTAPWAVGETLLGDVWCAEMREGKPSIEQLRLDRNELKEVIKKQKEDFEAHLLPLYVETDGSSEWATFVLTTAPRDTDLDQLDEHPRIEVIVDGAMGVAWLQRPLSEEELDLFEERNWPAVLGQDYVDPTPITEDRVLELREFKVSQ